LPPSTDGSLSDQVENTSHPSSNTGTGRERPFSPPEPWPRRLLEPSIAGVIGVAFALWGFFLGVRQLSDNSFFTHLATGRLMLDTGGIPSSDPYSFTARGEPWVVQSWLASLLYGLTDSRFGAVGLRVLTAVLCAAIAWSIWRLSRPANLLVRVGVVSMAMLVGAAMWSTRPLLFGLLFLAVALLAAEKAFDPRWLVPVFWLWVNTHGSFPLGLVALALLYAGRRADRQDGATELRALGWAALGTGLAVLNPLGPRILLFPIELLQRSESLQLIIEWQSPNFLGGVARVFLVQAIITILAMLRRPSWRGGMVFVVFLAASLLGQRNMAAASVVFVLVAANGLVGLGSLTGKDRSPVFGIFGAVLVVAVMAVSSSSLASPAYDLSAFPVDAVAWLEQNQAIGRTGVRLATSDTTGNFLELLYGDRAEAFMDDRVDMYPKDVVDDMVAVFRGNDQWERALDERGVDLILWERGGATSELIQQSSAWRVVYEDAKWLIACRRGSTVGSLSC